MEAAVTALRFNEMLRCEIRNRTTPADIINGLNDSLEGQIDPATFITCCIAVVDLPTGTVEIVNAGHCPPIHGGPKREAIWGRGARASVKTLHDEVETFIGGADRSDDLTLVVLLRDS
ncbi:MAG: hypothetical protein CME26_08170 [Gemmatimonadetes bacterium]|nr:hypothetical protein [Gemmatimonadota bacterium]|tara:strand:- start:3779 stop:4132 length:354 start_codon:yes stop_codon:yes gene_type:complete